MRITLGLLILALVSCNPETQGGNQSHKNGDFTIKIIDGCEYIEFDDGIFDQRVYSLTHKGNCKNHGNK